MTATVILRAERSRDRPMTTQQGTETPKPAGVVTRLALLAVELLIVGAAVVVIAERVSPPAPPSSCAAIPDDLGAAVGIPGPAPVFHRDDDENALVCRWRVQDVPDLVEVVVYSPGRWSAASAFTERRAEMEADHEAHPAPELGPEAFSVEEPERTDLAGRVLARSGPYIVLVSVQDEAPVAVDAERTALDLAARVLTALREVA